MIFNIHTRICKECKQPYDVGLDKDTCYNCRGIKEEEMPSIDFFKERGI